MDHNQRLDYVILLLFNQNFMPCIFTFCKDSPLFAIQLMSPYNVWS